MGYYGSYNSESGEYENIRTLTVLKHEHITDSIEYAFDSIPIITIDPSNNSFKYINGTLYSSNLNSAWRVYNSIDVLMGTNRYSATPTMIFTDNQNGYIFFYRPDYNIGQPTAQGRGHLENFTETCVNPVGGPSSNNHYFSYTGQENFETSGIENWGILIRTPYYFYEARDPSAGTVRLYRTTTLFSDTDIEIGNQQNSLIINKYVGYGYVVWYPKGFNYSLPDVVLNDAVAVDPSIDEKDPYINGGTASLGGGGGSFGKDEVSDSIDVPSGSVAGDASATGMFTRYLVNSSYLDILGDWLWSTDLGLQIAKTVISTIYGSPAESLISLMSYPFDIKTLSGVTSKHQNLFWGGHDTGIGFVALTSQSATVDWGTITLEEYWGNFLDYEPHTKIELYLPWGTGFVSIDPNMCLPGTLRVVTNIDLCKGSCVHNVIGNNNVVIGTYAGQCSQQIPIISNDYASKVAGVVVSATALAVAGSAGREAISAGIGAEIAYGRSHSLPFGDPKGTAEYLKGIETAGIMAQAPYRATQRTAGRLAATSSLAAFKRSGIISRNGSFTDGSASLGVQYPYIILSRPSQSVPKEYGSHYGYPSNIYANLGTINGYTEVGEIHLNGIRATDVEISELDSILKGGVIF